MKQKSTALAQYNAIKTNETPSSKLFILFQNLSQEKGDNPGSIIDARSKINAILEARINHNYADNITFDVETDKKWINSNRLTLDAILHPHDVEPYCVRGGVKTSGI